MKLSLTMFFLCAAGWLFQASAAEPTVADHKEFQETKGRAEKGDAAAQTDLGVMYSQGWGVAADIVVAYKWVLLAGAQVHEEAREAIPRIEFFFIATLEQRAEGQRLAREWKPQQNKP